jgi:hypothetical protein
MKSKWDGREVKEGDTVVRMLGGTIPMELKVTKIHEGLIHCGSWTFDQETGVEEDAHLGWGRGFGVTGSFLTEVK